MASKRAQNEASQAQDGAFVGQDGPEWAPMASKRAQNEASKAQDGAFVGKDGTEWAPMASKRAQNEASQAQDGATKGGEWGKRPRWSPCGPWRGVLERVVSYIEDLLLKRVA